MRGGAVLERDWHELDGRVRSVRHRVVLDGPRRVLHRQLQRVPGGGLLDHGGRDGGVGVHPMRCRAVLDWGGDERVDGLHLVRRRDVLDGPWRVPGQQLQRVRGGELLAHCERERRVGVQGVHRGDVLGGSLEVRGVQRRDVFDGASGGGVRRVRAGAVSEPERGERMRRVRAGDVQQRDGGLAVRRVPGEHGRSRGVDDDHGVQRERGVLCAVHADDRGNRDDAGVGVRPSDVCGADPGGGGPRGGGERELKGVRLEERPRI